MLTRGSTKTVSCMPIIASCSSQEDKETYTRFLFHLGVTMARELTYCFVGSLPGSSNNRSPWIPWTFEENVLGGVVRRYKSPDDPRGDRQAGDFWLLLKGNRKMWVIDPCCIRDIVDGNRRSYYTPVAFFPLCLMLTGSSNRLCETFYTCLVW